MIRLCQKDLLLAKRAHEKLLLASKKTTWQIRDESTASPTQPTLPSEADVVIIGGGSTGCSTLYHLAKEGVKAILLERKQLTAGETWHSAGLIMQMRPTDTEMRLRMATRKLLATFKDETGLDPGWEQNGGLYIARSKVRFDEYKRMSSLAKYFGIETSLLSPEQTKEIFPLLKSEMVFGALHCPSDGVVDPVQYCKAMTSYAINQGAQVVENCPVTGIHIEKSRANGNRIEGISTPFGDIKTKKIVNATGAWAPKAAKLAGVTLPVVPFKHAYVVSQPIKDIRGKPSIRDADGRIYFRVKEDSLCVGGFEKNPIMLDQISDDHAFDLFELDWKVFEYHMNHAVEIMPKFETCGIKTTVCGSECFSPDLKPLLGEDPRVGGLYHSCGFNAAGVVLSGGSGEQLAKWIVEGRPDMHMYSCDIRRFTPEELSNASWAAERCHESYVNNYKIHFPHDEPLAGRNLKTDPFHEELLVAGAVYEEVQGYERPGWFNPQGYNPVLPYDWYGSYGNTKNLDKRYLSMLKGDRSFGFSKHHLAIGSECLACREQVVMMDFSYFCKLYMVGPETQEASDWLFTNDTHVPYNKTVYTCLLNRKGGIEADLLVTPVMPGSGTMADPVFKGRGMFIVAGGASASQTRAHILSEIRNKDFQVHIADLSAQVGLLAIQGPASRDLLQELVDCDLSNETFPYATSRIIRLAGHQVRAMRTSFVGELGWEIHIPWHNCIPVYLALWEKGKNYGLRHAGFRALYSLCSEKGYRLWNQDVRSEDNPIEAGLGSICRTEGDYLGKEAVEYAREHGIKKRHVMMTMTEPLPLYGTELIIRNGVAVGYLTRGEYGFSLGCSVGQGYIRHPDGENVTEEYIMDGTYELEVLGRRYPATVHLKSPFDPKNKRFQGIYDEPLPVRQAFAQ